MKLNAPFRLSQSIVLNLTDAEANGNLGNLAGNPQAFQPIVALVGATLPVPFQLPQASYIEKWSITNLTVTDAGNVAMIFSNNDGQFDAATYQPISGPLATGYVTHNVVGTYNNGTLGVGATLTTALASITYDDPSGGNVANGDLVYLTGQTSQNRNGLYVASGVGVAIVLTRSTHFDTIAEAFEGSLHWIANNSNSIIMVQSTGTLFGVDPILIVVEESTSWGTGAEITADTVYLNGSADTIIGNSADQASQGYVNMTGVQNNIIMPMPVNPSSYTIPAIDANPIDYYLYLRNVAG